MEDIGLLYIVGTLFSLVLVSFISAYIFMYQKKTNQYTVGLKEKELSKQQDLLSALNNGEEKERKRLAAELHDGIGAKLSGLKMSMEYITEQKVTNFELLRTITLGINETIEEVREISHNLKPSSLLSKGLNQTLNEHVQHLNKKGNCQYKLFFENMDTVLSQELQFALYRIISELINNIVKHAQATQASIQLITNAERKLLLISEDNGIGFELKNMTKGIGLLNITDRLKGLNGSINIDSSAIGTTIIIELPLT